MGLQEDFNKFVNSHPYHNPSYQEMKALVDSGNKVMMFYHISKEEVVQKDLRGIEGLLNNLKKLGKPLRDSLIITCGGYDDVAEELHEIEDVREFANLLMEKMPHLLYYTNHDMEGDVWILCSVADEVLSVVKEGEKMSANELYEKYGVDNMPHTQSLLTFRGDKLAKMLKAIIRHGKINKDVRGAKRSAIQYALKFSFAEKTLEDIGISRQDLIDLGFSRF